MKKQNIDITEAIKKSGVDCIDLSDAMVVELGKEKIKKENDSLTLLEKIKKNWITIFFVLFIVFISITKLNATVEYQNVGFDDLKKLKIEMAKTQYPNIPISCETGKKIKISKDKYKKIIDDFNINYLTLHKKDTQKYAELKMLIKPILWAPINDNTIVINGKRYLCVNKKDMK